MKFYNILTVCVALTFGNSSFAGENSENSSIRMKLLENGRVAFQICHAGSSHCEGFGDPKGYSKYELGQLDPKAHKKSAVVESVVYGGLILGTAGLAAFDLALGATVAEALSFFAKVAGTVTVLDQASEAARKANPHYLYKLAWLEQSIQDGVAKLQRPGDVLYIDIDPKDKVIVRQQRIAARILKDLPVTNTYPLSEKTNATDHARATSAL